MTILEFQFEVVHMHVLYPINDVEDNYNRSPIVYHGNFELPMWNEVVVALRKLLLDSLTKYSHQA